MTSVIRLPVMSVVELAGESEAAALRHWKGYVRMSEHQCGRIFRQGWIALREFTAMDRTRTFRLPETSDDLIVEYGDLVVLEAERKRMEAKYPGLVNGPRPGEGAKACVSGNPPATAMDPTYRIVHVDDREYRFGETQAKILRRLSEAANAGEPWQSGKLLLRSVHSQSFSLSNLFKRHPVWRELIVSNRRGFYRLNDRFIDRGHAPGERAASKSPKIIAGELSSRG